MGAEVMGMKILKIKPMGSPELIRSALRQKNPFDDPVWIKIGDEWRTWWLNKSGVNLYDLQGCGYWLIDPNGQEISSPPEWTYEDDNTHILWYNEQLEVGNWIIEGEFWTETHEGFRFGFLGYPKGQPEPSL